MNYNTLVIQFVTFFGGGGFPKFAIFFFNLCKGSPSPSIRFQISTSMCGFEKLKSW